VVKVVNTEEPLTSISFSEDGQMLAAGGMNGGLLVYDLRKIQVPLFRLTGHCSAVKNVCFNERDKMQNQEN
jgi:WD40 repeat protein